MKRVERSNVAVVALSHTGRKRKENEDRYGVSSFRLDNNEPVLLAVLADGIGGHRAGEIAAELAVNRISHVVAESDAQDPAEILTYAVQEASDAIRDQAGTVMEQAGMGATCACAWMIGLRLYTATVGDSRVYLLKGGKIFRLSTDHTWVQEAIENGLLLPEEVTGHPNAHIIRRYLGSPTAPEVDLRLRLSAEESDEKAVMNQGLQLEPGDRVLLTSDGLTDLVTDVEILDAYLRYPADEATRMLIERANARGGHDNITLVTFQVPPPQVAVPSRARRSAALTSWRWVGMGCAGVLAAALLVGGLAGGWWWLTEGRQGGVTPAPGTTATQMFTAAPGNMGGETPPPSPTLMILSPTIGPTVRPTSALESGPTLTPWPTNTFAAP